MNDLLIFAADYLKDKSHSQSVRKLFDLLFNVSISSFIYEKCYGSYIWLNYNDYKGILDFFIKGNFFIPFSIFLVVYGLTEFLSIAIFAIYSEYKLVEKRQEIIRYQFNKNRIDKQLKKFEKDTKKVSPIKLSKELIIQVYQNLRNQIKPELFKEIDKGLKKSKQEIKAYFSLFFRMIVAITIYFTTLPNLSLLLYILSIIVLLIGMYLLIILYCFFDIIPAILRKFHYQAEQYLKLQIEQENQINNY